MSAALVSLNDPRQCVDTLLHEIAHALAGPVGHGEEWKAKARAIGCTAMRCYGTDVVQPQGNWLLTCSRCGKKLRDRHKRPTHVLLHKHCGGRVSVVSRVSGKTR